MNTISWLGLGVGFDKWFVSETNVYSPISKTQNESATQATESDRQIDNRLIYGDKILIRANLNSKKATVIQALNAGYLDEAIAEMKAYLKKSSNDPEALIYLNNAQAVKAGNTLNIGVSVPIGGHLNVAQ